MAPAALVRWPESVATGLSQPWDYAGPLVYRQYLSPTPKLKPIAEWQDSLDAGQQALCCFHGGFLLHFMQTLDLWYGRGVRMFKFDFANFAAAPRMQQETLLPSEIRAANVIAFQGALRAFRKEHPDAVLLGYNGYEEWPIQGRTDEPLRKAMDLRWLDVFDTLYCGDPRPADVPAMSFWRSKDVYSDHMVRFYYCNGIPLERIDNCGFMIGTTGTCYCRGTAAWQGMLVLSLARGGWVNIYHGNLELIDREKAAWFARVQALFLRLQGSTRTTTFSGLPGFGQPYGYAAMQDGDGLLTVVNPGQRFAAVELPAHGPLRVLFHDAGPIPSINDRALVLGPEQMALVGVGAYAEPKFDLGVQDDVLIPTAIQPVDAVFEQEGDQAITTTLQAPREGVLRIIMRQYDEVGRAKRSSGGSPPGGMALDRILGITVRQSDREIPVRITYDKAIWSGLSWAAGEVPCNLLEPDRPVVIRCSTTEPTRVTLTGELYAVRYR